LDGGKERARGIKVENFGTVGTTCNLIKKKGRTRKSPKGENHRPLQRWKRGFGKKKRRQ